MLFLRQNRNIFVGSWQDMYTLYFDLIFTIDLSVNKYCFLVSQQQYRMLKTFLYGQFSQFSF